MPRRIECHYVVNSSISSTPGRPMLRIPFSTIAILAYGAIYFLLTSLMEAE